MCGISGLYVADGSYGIAEVVKKMVGLLRHRGPDRVGIWVDPQNRIALGHARLSIVDPTPRSDQPMASASGRYVLAYNGEIYNYRSLRSRLEEIGRSMKTSSDTEVLLEAIEAFGCDATLEMAEGMFAFALWDRTKEQLLLCRDRFGIKPCYWSWQRGVFAFASELKAIMRISSLGFTIEPAAIRSLLNFGYVQSPRTALTEVHQLEPGTILVISRNNPPKISHYWRLEEIKLQKANAHAGKSPDELLAEFDILLCEAVERYLCADVPVGTFLSGGIDSSLVTAVAARVAGRKIKSFSLGFAESAWDESKKARAIASHIGTDHHELELSPTNARDLVDSIPEFYDEPFADFSQLPTLAINRFAREHVKVCLSGDGGDELFAGYPRYQWSQDAWNTLSRMPSASQSRMLRYLRSRKLPTFTRRVLPARLSATVDELNKKLPFGRDIRIFSDFYRKMMQVGPDSLFDGPDVVDFDDWPAAKALTLTDKMQLHDLRRYMGDGILTKVDRASMSVGLEVRIPLLSEPLANFTFGLPEASRIGLAGLRNFQRQLTYRYVPRNLLDGEKQGFGFPVDSWLRTGLRDWVDDLLTSDGLRTIPYLRHEAVKRLWSEHRSGQAERHWQLWPAIMYVQWYRRWKSCLSASPQSEFRHGSRIANILQPDCALKTSVALT
jgi:asparagine synthase (glutamine-hydrolysing)